MSAKFFVGAALLFGTVGALAYRRRSTRGGLGDALGVAPDRSPLRMPANWWRQPPPPAPKPCYRSKGAALRQFVEANRDIIEQYSGINHRESPAEFDAINHKYGLRGKHAVRSIAEALWVAMPPGRPYCLEDIDLDALNRTAPARTASREETPFRLPDYVEEARLLRAEIEHYRRAAADE